MVVTIDWDDAYRIHARTVMKLAFVVLRDEEQAMDVVQSTFEVAYRKAVRYDPSRPLGPWLIGIATREALRLARRERLRRFLPLRVDDEERSRTFDESTLDVWNAVRRLTPPLRATVALHYVAGYKVDEIATILKIPRGTVASRLNSSTSPADRRSERFRSTRTTQPRRHGRSSRPDRLTRSIAP